MNNNNICVKQIIISMENTPPIVISMTKNLGFSLINRIDNSISEDMFLETKCGE